MENLMTDNHEKLLNGISEQMKPVLDSSQQAIYIYLDDTHLVCNSRFANLLGYASAQELASVEKNLLAKLVVDKSQETLVTNYRKAMEKMVGSTFPITWRKKMGGSVDTTVILVPISYEGHLFALHFIS
jgi:PAS domain-containing protein